MDIPKEKLENILKAAVQAPSGDNSQPWKFQIRGNTISVVNIPERDTSLFNYRQTSNYIALGAAIENLRIASGAEGYKTIITLFPKDKGKYVAADVTLESGEASSNGLSQYIQKRTSNRKKYSSKPISSDIISELERALRDSRGRMELITERDSLNKIAHIVSVGEKIALENKNIHDFLFQHVTWNAKDDAKRHGFYIKTFEFKPPQEAIFKLFSNWKILSFCNQFGTSDFIAKDMERVYASSAAFGAIIIPEVSKEYALETGIMLERLWLTATKLQLSFQAATTVPFLSIPIRDGAVSGLSKKHEDLITERYQALVEEFKVSPREIILFVFRLGYADPPSAFTTRSEPIIEYL